MCTVYIWFWPTLLLTCRYQAAGAWIFILFVLLPCNVADQSSCDHYHSFSTLPRHMPYFVADQSSCDHFHSFATLPRHMPCFVADQAVTSLSAVTLPAPMSPHDHCCRFQCTGKQQAVDTLKVIPPTCCSSCVRSRSSRCANSFCTTSLAMAAATRSCVSMQS